MSVGIFVPFVVNGGIPIKFDLVSIVLPACEKTQAFKSTNLLFFFLNLKKSFGFSIVNVMHPNRFKCYLMKPLAKYPHYHVFAFCRFFLELDPRFVKVDQ